MGFMTRLVSETRAHWNALVSVQPEPRGEPVALFIKFILASLQTLPSSVLPTSVSPSDSVFRSREFGALNFNIASCRFQHRGAKTDTPGVSDTPKRKEVYGNATLQILSANV